MTLKRLLTSPAIAALPLIALALCIGLWASDVFDWDEWIIWTEALRKLQTGTFGLADLMSQQNEQRNLAARLFGLLLFPAFRLNRLAECALNVGLAGLGLFFAARLYRLTRDEASDETPLVVFSLFAFSLMQWESFSVGINSSVLLPVLGMWCGAWLLASPGLGWGRLGLTALAGVLPSFSFVNGLFFWPCFAPVVFLRAERRLRLAETLAFLAAGAAMWLAYFHGYTTPPHHPATGAALARPDRLAGYALAYLGGAVTGDRNLLPLAMLAGLSVLVLLGRAAWDATRHGRLVRLAPWLAVAAFSLLSALATAVGRSGFGLGQALESRYATFSSPLWMATFALLGLTDASWTDRRGWTRRVLATCLGLLLVSNLLSAIVLRNHTRRLDEARAELFRLTDPRRLDPMFPDPAYVMRALPVFLDSRAAMFRNIPLRKDCTVASGIAGAFALRPFQGAPGRLCGALFTGSATPGGVVLVALPEGFAAAGRADASGGFSLFVPNSALPGDEFRVAMFALEGRTLRPLSPEDGVLMDNARCPEPDAAIIDSHFYFPRSENDSIPVKRNLK